MVLEAAILSIPLLKTDLIVMTISSRYSLVQMMKTVMALSDNNQISVSDGHVCVVNYSENQVNCIGTNSWSSGSHIVDSAQSYYNGFVEVGTLQHNLHSR